MNANGANLLPLPLPRSQPRPPNKTIYFSFFFSSFFLFSLHSIPSHSINKLLSRRTHAHTHTDSSREENCAFRHNKRKLPLRTYNYCVISFLSVHVFGLFSFLSLSLLWKSSVMFGSLLFFLSLFRTNKQAKHSLRTSSLPTEFIRSEMI